MSAVVLSEYLSFQNLLQWVCESSRRSYGGVPQSDPWYPLLTAMLLLESTVLKAIARYKSWVLTKPRGTATVWGDPHRNLLGGWMQDATKDCGTVPCVFMPEPLQLRYHARRPRNWPLCPQLVDSNSVICACHAACNM